MELGFGGIPTWAKSVDYDRPMRFLPRVDQRCRPEGARNGWRRQHHCCIRYAQRDLEKIRITAVDDQAIEHGSSGKQDAQDAVKVYLGVRCEEHAEATGRRQSRAEQRLPSAACVLPCGVIRLDPKSRRHTAAPIQIDETGAVLARRGRCKMEGRARYPDSTTGTGNSENLGASSLDRALYCIEDVGVARRIENDVFTSFVPEIRTVNKDVRPSRNHLVKVNVPRWGRVVEGSCSGKPDLRIAAYHGNFQQGGRRAIRQTRGPNGFFDRSNSSSQHLEPGSGDRDVTCATEARQN